MSGQIEAWVLDLIQSRLDLGNQDCHSLLEDYRIHSSGLWSSFLTDYYRNRPDEIGGLKFEELLEIPAVLRDTVRTSEQVKRAKIGVVSIKDPPYLVIKYPNLTLSDNRKSWWLLNGRLADVFAGEEALSRIIFDESDETKPNIRIPSDMLLAVYSREMVPQYIYFKSTTKAIKFPTDTLFPKIERPLIKLTDVAQAGGLRTGKVALLPEIIEVVDEKTIIEAFEFIYRFGIPVHQIAKERGFYEWEAERKEKSDLEKYQELCQYVDHQIIPYFNALKKRGKISARQLTFLRNFLEDILKLTRLIMVIQVSDGAVGFSLLYLYRMGMDKDTRFPWDPFKKHDPAPSDILDNPSQTVLDPGIPDFRIPYGIDEVGPNDLLFIHTCAQLLECRNKKCGKPFIGWNAKQYLCPECSNKKAIRASVMREMKKEKNQEKD